MGRLHKAVREVVDYAEEHGFTLLPQMTGRGHWLLEHRSGERITIGGTPKGGQWARNAKATIRRIDRGGPR